MTDQYALIQDRLDKFERNMETQFLDTKNRVVQVEAKLTQIMASITFDANQTDKLKTEVIPQMQHQFKAEVDQVSRELERINIYVARENLVFLGILERGSRESG